MPSTATAPRRRKFILTIDHLLIALGVVAAIVLVVAYVRNSHGGSQKVTPGTPFPLSIVVGTHSAVATCTILDRRAKLTFDRQAVANTANNAYLIAQAVATDALGLGVVLSGNTASEVVTNIPGVGNDVKVTRYGLATGGFFFATTVRDDNIVGVTCWVDK